MRRHAGENSAVSIASERLQIWFAARPTFAIARGSRGVEKWWEGCLFTASTCCVALQKYLHKAAVDCDAERTNVVSLQM